MQGSTMKWEPKAELAIDALLAILKESIITNAEMYSQWRKINNIDIQSAEIALYKSIVVFNEINKVAIMKRIGPEGKSLIKKFEDRAIEDVTIVIFKNLLNVYDHLPKEVQEFIDAMKKKFPDLTGEDNKEK